MFSILALGRRPHLCFVRCEAGAKIGCCMTTVTEVVENIGLGIDGLGVLAIVLGLFWATLGFGAALRRESNSYRRYRQDLGRGILLGLEFLVAADIIRTVAVTPT